MISKQAFYLFSVDVDKWMDIYLSLESNSFNNKDDISNTIFSDDSEWVDTINRVYKDK